MTTYYDPNQLRANPSKTQVCAFHLRNREAKRELNVVWNGTRLSNTTGERRKAESAWRRTKLEVHRQIFVAARDECNDLITQTKTTFYRDKLQYADNKSIFQIVGSLSGKPPPSYPDHDSISECVNTFSAYFTGKISEIRTKHRANSKCDTPLSARRFLTPIVTFDATCVSEVEVIITCRLEDHVKNNIGSLASIISLITNASSDGVMPNELKRHLSTRCSRKRHSVGTQATIDQSATYHNVVANINAHLCNESLLSSQLTNEITRPRQRYCVLSMRSGLRLTAGNAPLLQ